MKKNFSQYYRHKNYFILLFQFLISVLLAFMIILLVIFIGQKIYSLFMVQEQRHFIHDVVFLIVLIKILLLLFSYFKKHYISVKYIMEISIIAPAIEIVFASDTHPPFTLILFAVFTLSNLLIYILFQEKIKKIGS